MVRFYLAIIMLVGFGLIGFGLFDYAVASNGDESPIVIPFKLAAGAKMLAGVFLLTLTAIGDEVIAIGYRIERHVAPAVDPEAPRKRWWRR